MSNEIKRKKATEEVDQIQTIVGNIYSEIQYYNNPPPNQWVINKLKYIRRELKKLLESIQRD